jgi:glycosyltransferase involved in cell wall biosynthesis
MARPTLLISLPTGFTVGGVTTFAVRLASGLAARGRGAALLVHEEPSGCARLAIDLHPAVELIRPGLRPFEASPGDLSSFLPHYRDALRRLAAMSGAPVAFAPQMHGDGFGIAAAVALTEPELLRTIGWQHSDIEYDSRILARFEPVIHAFVAVSDRIASTLRRRLPGRAVDIHAVPCGVEPVDPGASRDWGATEVPSGASPLRLVYTGRIEHQQKRILALVHLSDELSRRGVLHTMIAVGDGPAAAEFDSAIASRPRIRRLAPVPPAEISRLLDAADALILPSRYEGLSVSMLEAMARGVPPILSRTASGAAQAVEPGYNGEIADVAPEADECATARALADAVQRFLGRDRAAMSAAARQTIRDRFSLNAHVDRIAGLVDSVAGLPPRTWPADRPCAFTASGLPFEGAGSPVSSGSVPADGPARLRALLASLAGRSIILHGAGQHTLQLAAVLADSPARIVAMTDDDRQNHGRHLWGWPIIAPDAASATGATDVVISSWMHQAAIWSRRDVYERQHLRVHRIYAQA